MNRFFGMMPCNEIDKEETFIDENNYKGLNLLGKALMQVREELK